ncbi:MAG: molybdopterin-guanine dinucleotide biosynthesis protein B [Candidatus Thermoplasmatota archaeon]|nr:molybdopterin-guanine dinucleotide biosynthesis protein B [Candidatus Thermoplasmatota archaeon]
MSAPVVYGVYGPSDSGKTRLVEQLVTTFTKDGYSVATVKQTHKAISLDMAHKDTWRHHAAGARLVVFSSASETVFLVHHRLDSSTILQRVHDFGGIDLVLVEGARDPSIPKIQLGMGKKRTHTLLTYSNNYSDVLSIIKKELKMKQSLHRIHITVNGKSIPLSAFPESIFTNTLIGMLQSLKGVRDITDVTIQLHHNKKKKR